MNSRKAADASPFGTMTAPGATPCIVAVTRTGRKTGYSSRVGMKNDRLDRWRRVYPVASEARGRYVARNEVKVLPPLERLDVLQLAYETPLSRNSRHCWWCPSQ